MGGCTHCGAGQGRVRTLEVVSGSYRGRRLDLSLCDFCRVEFESADDITLVDPVETE